MTDVKVLSPARAAGLPLRFHHRKVCWSAALAPYKLRDKVRIKIDPRHRGEIIAVVRNKITVRWENGWTSEHDVKEILLEKDVEE